MSKLERWGLFSGIIGFISDTIALITFFAGHWGSPVTTSVAVPATAQAQGTTIVINGYEIPIVIRSVMILVLIYSWAMVSWILVRRCFRLRKFRNAEIITNIVFRAVTGIGILVLPIFMMWMITYYQSGVPTRAEGDKAYAEFYARNTHPTTGQGDALCSPGGEPFSGSNCIWDQSDAAYWAVPASIVLQGFIAGAVYLLFVLLIPVIYPDMSAEEIAYELGLTPATTILESKNEEEALAKVLPMRAPTGTKAK